ncbi:inosine triphosphate pyrophosphatase-like protein [Kipferlia bialata]|uniref:inosine/xanthosine triphosphatase n=1 Tax=Kipferlia bialata TaxID=797122 RepID=A0A9K3CU64_9EUKA|nr:inosine triphosphate pyrophosphatase-like protein [Kipferlia bialata]|eukprot:g4699.t1
MTQSIVSGTIRIAIGTKSKAKIRACEIAFGQCFPGATLDITPVPVPSGVKDQPLTAQDSLLGARTRALGALSLCPVDVDYAVGMEGGIERVGEGEAGVWLESGWMVVLDKDGVEGVGTGPRFQVGEPVMSRILGGQELSHAMKDLSQLESARVEGAGAPSVEGVKLSGTISILTHGTTDRTAVYAMGTVMALARFMSHTVYWQ